MRNTVLLPLLQPVVVKKFLASWDRFRIVLQEECIIIVESLLGHPIAGCSVPQSCGFCTRLVNLIQTYPE